MLARPVVLGGIGGWKHGHGGTWHGQLPREWRLLQGSTRTATALTQPLLCTHPPQSLTPYSATTHHPPTHPPHSLTRSCAPNPCSAPTRTHLNSRRRMVDFPLPVAPTRATVEPPGTLNVTLCSTGAPSVYCGQAGSVMWQGEGGLLCNAKGAVQHLVSGTNGSWRAGMYHGNLNTSHANAAKRAKTKHSDFAGAPGSRLHGSRASAARRAPAPWRPPCPVLCKASSG